MSLDGLRAWIGQLEWKLGRRTRVFLVLSVIAIGASGTAVYLAIDAQNSAVSESDVQELQQELEAQIVAGGGDELTRLRAEVEALEARVKELEGGGAADSDRGREGTKGEQSGGSSPNGSGGSNKGASEESGSGTGSGSAADLEDFLQRAKEQQE